jgi:hypothetical protein
MIATSPRIVRAAVLVAAAVLWPALATAETRQPVKSLKEIRRSNVVVQEWDLSCGAATLTTVLNIQHGDPVTEKEVARGLIRRQEYIDQPELVRIREGFSLLDLKRYVDQRGYRGIGYGKLEVENLIELAPILVPINTIGYNHFVIFRGIAGDRVLLADPAWGNRTMTVERFEHSWIDYGTIGRVGFVVARADGPVPAPAGDLAPRLEDFLTLN